ELEVHVTAALLFSSFDGRLFDAGRTSAHVARAERLLSSSRSEVPRFLLWLSQLLAAYLLNDAPFIQLILDRAPEVDQDLRWPVLRCFSIESRLIQSYFARRPVAVAHYFQELLRLTAEGPFPLFHVRALSQAARDQVDEG